MHRHLLTITLQDDIVLSQTNATTGDHESLDYIPGSALLGIAARAYQDFSADEQWLIFHSGKVRFGNGYILSVAGEVGYPMPLSLHFPKGQDSEIGDQRKVLTAFVKNIAVASKRDAFISGEQPKQMRKGYLTESGEVLTVLRSSSLKTAIDPEAGRVAEGQLFGYEAIIRGQRFQSDITADADISDSLIEKLLAVLQKNPRLGRSRSAQYGRVKIEVNNTVKQPVAAKADNARLVLWLLSDMALKDENGNALLAVNGEALGLASAELETAYSYSQVRRYSPFNAWRRSYDAERQVLRAGSVLVFKLSEPLNDAQLEHLGKGVGAYQESGLGRVLVNPAQLSAVDVPVATLKQAPKVEKPTLPNTSLIKWLGLRSAAQSSNVDQRVYAAIDELETLYRTARLYAGALRGVEVGPGNTQWGRVGNIAKLSDATPGNIMSRLFGSKPGQASPKDDVVCKGDDWLTEGFPDNKLNQTFVGWLHGTLEKQAGESDFVTFVQKLAREAKSTKISNARAGLMEK